VLCAADCTIGDDGSFTDAQFTAFECQPRRKRILVLPKV